MALPDLVATFSTYRCAWKTLEETAAWDWRRHKAKRRTTWWLWPLHFIVEMWARKYLPQCFLNLHEWGCIFFVFVRTCQHRVHPVRLHCFAPQVGWPAGRFWDGERRGGIPVRAPRRRPTDKLHTNSSGLLQVDVRADAKTEVLRLLTCAHSLERYLKLPSTTRCNGFRLIAAPSTWVSLTCPCRTNQDIASFVHKVVSCIWQRGSGENSSGQMCCHWMLNGSFRMILTNHLTWL